MKDKKEIVGLSVTIYIILMKN